MQTGKGTVMHLHEVTPGWRSMSGHHKRCVIYRQLPEPAGQVCYSVDGDRHTGHHSCASTSGWVDQAGWIRCATCFPMAEKRPWRSLAADSCVKCLWRDLLTPSLALAPTGLWPLSQAEGQPRLPGRPAHQPPAAQHPTHRS